MSFVLSQDVPEAGFAGENATAEIPKDTLAVLRFTERIEEGPELKTGMALTVNNDLEDPFSILEFTNNIKQEPEVMLDEDGAVNDVLENPESVSEWNMNVKKELELTLDENEDENGFEFVPVKQEPLEYRGTDGLETVQEPECIIVQKLEPCGDDVQPGGLDATQEPECIIVPKLEPCDDDVQPGGLDATQVHKNMAPEMLPKCLAGAVQQEEVILGLDPETQWEPGAAETYFDRTRFGDCSTAPTETAIPAQVGRVSTNGEFAEYHLHESSSLNNCTTTTATAASAKRKFLQRFKCSSCSSPFTSKHGLIRHVFTHIPDVASPDLVCRVCGEVSDNAESAVSHVIGHTIGRGGSSGTYGRCGAPPVRRKPPKRVHGCAVCGKTFPTPQSLNIHTRIHSGERPYPC